MNKLLLAVFACLWLNGCAPCLALPIWNETNVVKALAGEAGGQSEIELLAHAHAIHNRGSLAGVYGFNAKVSPKALKRAKKAYLESLKSTDITHGCTHWLSEYDFKKCIREGKLKLICWRYQAIYMIKIGQTTFYKLK